MGSFPISSDKSAIVTVDVQAAKSLIVSDHRYLDVRTEEEFKKGHLENAFNIPFMILTPQGRVRNERFLEQVSTVCNKDDLLLVGCQSGVRSLQASVDLVNDGFKNAKNVEGGYAAWVENGFDVKKPEEESKTSKAAANVDVHAAKSLVGADHRYLDVRTKEEFDKGHLENSLNISYMFFTPEGRVKNQEFVEQVSLVYSKEDHIILGCQSGVRSLQAANDLLKAGFKHAKNMEGGYVAWVANGFYVKKTNEER